MKNNNKNKLNHNFLRFSLQDYVSLSDTQSIIKSNNVNLMFVK